MISVAMTTYNGASFVEEQLNSIVNQSLLPDEIIIVDDNSSDETVSLINRFIECYNYIYIYKR